MTDEEHLQRVAGAGSRLAQLELAKRDADPHARALLDLMQDRRRVQLLARILADLRRDP